MTAREQTWASVTTPLWAGSTRSFYYHSVVTFLVAVVLPVLGAVGAAIWHVLSKHNPPKFEDLAVGFDILVAAVVMQMAFIPGSSSLVEAAVRWAGVGVLGIMLGVMAVLTRFCGYEEGQKFVSAVVLTRCLKEGRLELPGLDEELIVYPMKSSAVKLTSSIGCAVIGTFGVLNEHIGWVLSALHLKH